jgi:hypothetical protein
MIRDDGRLALMKDFISQYYHFGVPNFEFNKMSWPETDIIDISYGFQRTGGLAHNGDGGLILEYKLDKTGMEFFLSDVKSNIKDSESNTVITNRESLVEIFPELSDISNKCTRMNTFKTNATCYVSAPSGLYLRKSPETGDNKIFLIPFNSIVIITGKSYNIYTNDGITNYWYRVNYHGREGWTFGGYLKEEL